MSEPGVNLHKPAKTKAVDPFDTSRKKMVELPYCAECGKKMPCPTLRLHE